MNGLLSYWVVVTAKETSGETFQIPGKTAYTIHASIQQFTSRRDAIMRYCPHVIDVVPIRGNALNHTGDIHHKLIEMVECTDSTGRKLSEIQEGVRAVMDHLFDQFSE